MTALMPYIDVLLYALIALPPLALALGALSIKHDSAAVSLLTGVRAVLQSLLNMIGRATAWLSLIMVLVMFTIVLMRYVFGISFIWLQESITYMHGLLFMLASAYTLSIDGHVRVDIFYREASEHKKAITNLLGIYLLLFPFMFLIVDMALPYVQTAWEVREGSKETSGIQAIYLLKTVILAFAWTMILQGISLACSAALYLLGAAESQNPFAEDESIQSERASDNG